jgi:cysteine dioxygenase
MDGLCQPADLERVRELMLAANVERADMVDACKFSNVTYARNLLAKSPWYELLVICWRDGQSSPIHDHYGSACGVRIVDGVATEAVFEETSPGLVRPVCERTFEPGQVIVSSDTDIHLITNQQPGRDLVTLHLYTPPLHMRYYQLDHELALT